LWRRKQAKLNETFHVAQPVFYTALNANGIRNEAQKERKNERKKERKKEKQRWRYTTKEWKPPSL
jgi:hypothetical protein